MISSILLFIPTCQNHVIFDIFKNLSYLVLDFQESCKNSKELSYTFHPVPLKYVTLKIILIYSENVQLIERIAWLVYSHVVSIYFFHKLILLCVICL